MKKYIFIIALLMGCQIGFSAPKKIGIALLPFKVVSHDNSLNYLSKGIPDILITTLAQNNGITIVERDRINDIIKELELTTSEVFDDKNAVKIGKLTKSRYIITGTLTVIESQIRIDARLIDIETGKIQAGFSEQASEKKYIFNAIDLLSAKISHYLTGKSPLPTDKSRPALDICFLIDATGSMDDEIDVVRKKIRQIMVQVQDGTPKPQVRFAIVNYKDEGDEYITQNLDFTDNIQTIHHYLNQIQASGGGDFEESLLEGLQASIYQLKWNPTAGKMIFLVGDAPPHNRSKLNLDQLLSQAIKSRIAIYPIACSGIDKNGVQLFQKIATTTNGKFNFLTYKQQYVTQTGEKRNYIVRGDRVYKSKREVERKDWSEADDFAGSKSFSESEESGGEGYSAEDRLKNIDSPSSPSQLRKSGELENNLDSVILKGIQKEGKKIGIQYQNHPVHLVTLQNGPITKNVQLSDPKVMEQLTKAYQTKSTIWIAVSINANNSNSHPFQLTKDSILIYPAKQVPEMAQTTFQSISEDPVYYENNGLFHPKRWFVPVKVVSIKSIVP